MHILCTICSDLVNSAESVCVTKCGHIFHYHCLAQWNERSKTCPQCRHSVTPKCVFRVYPTISNETSVDDVTTLQSQLDDAKLTTRQQTGKIKELEDKIVTLNEDFKKNEKILKDTEKKLVVKESTVSALKEQLDYVKIQNKETQKLKADNEALQRNLHTLNGLQKVLNATTLEVEKMLESYTDVRTIATFAAALKRALCESESRKNESRDKLVETQQTLAKERKESVEWQHKYLITQEKYNEAEERIKRLQNRKTSEAPKQIKKPEVKTPEVDFNTAIRIDKDSPFLLPPTKMDLDTSFFDDSFAKMESKNNLLSNSMVKRIETADSPYLALKQNSLLPLSSIQRREMAPNHMRPSDFVTLNKSRKENAPSTSQKQNLDISIFHKKFETKLPQHLNNLNLTQRLSKDVLYDGLGGHSKLDPFPVLKSPIKTKSMPVLTAKHKLKRPLPSGSQDIGSFLKRMKDKDK